MSRQCTHKIQTKPPRSIAPRVDLNSGVSSAFRSPKGAKSSGDDMSCYEGGWREVGEGSDLRASDETAFT